MYTRAHAYTHTNTGKTQTENIVLGRSFTNHVQIHVHDPSPTKKGPHYYVLGIQVPHFSLNYHSVEKLYLLTRKSICSVFSMLYYIKQIETFFR